METVLRKVDVKERLPEKEGNYSVLTAYGDDIEKRFFTGSIFTNYDGYKVTHWYEEIELSSIGGEEKTLDLGQLFKNNSDCYADTRIEIDDTIPPSLIDGPVVMAMTEERFIEVVSSLAIPSKKGEPNTEEILSKVKELSVYKKAVNDWKGTKFKPLVVDYIRLDEVLEILEPKK